MKYCTIILLVLLFNCNTEKSNGLSAQDVIDKSIEVSGVSLINNSFIEFNFRNVLYTAKRNGGNFRLSRSFEEDSMKIDDILTNQKFERFINAKPIKLEDSTASKFSASVNSVHYFSVLPYGLNDQAVIKKLLASRSIKNQRYYTVKVTFKEDGGGKDFEDEFLYWVNKDNYNIDYFAYSYMEEDGAGIRFRKAFNERFLDEIRFVDYKNYKPKTNNIKLEQLPDLFEKEELILVSKIELKDIKVTLLPTSDDQ